MAIPLLAETILQYLAAQRAQGRPRIGARELAERLQVPRTSLNRHLIKMTEEGVLTRKGIGRSTSYQITATAESARTIANETVADSKMLPTGPTWGASARTRLASLRAPLGLRTPVSYQRQFVDGYRPNESSLLPASLAVALHEQGRLQGQQPAGTYARRVLEQLLIDLSWYSSRLEGNRKSLLDTRDLFLNGRSPDDDADATMLLNHKDPIEFIVDALPTHGITTQVIRNVQ